MKFAVPKLAAAFAALAISSLVQGKELVYAPCPTGMATLAKNAIAVQGLSAPPPDAPHIYDESPAFIGIGDGVKNQSGKVASKVCVAGLIGEVSVLVNAEQRSLARIYKQILIISPAIVEQLVERNI